MKLKVEVTQEDINNGVRQDAEKCPIACALKRLVQNPEVENDIEFDKEGIRFIANLTDKAASFIKDFDEKGLIAVQPFSFEIKARKKEFSDYE